MSALKIFRHTLQNVAAITFCFLLLSVAPCSAGTEKDFFQGSDMQTAGNYNPAGLPSGTSDVLLTTPSTALTLSGSGLTMNSLNMTASNVSYTLSNGSSISLNPFMGGGNSISGVMGDAIYLGGTNSSLTLQGVGVDSGVGGNFNVAQASSTLNISGHLSLDNGAFTKTGAGVLNLSGQISAAQSGSLATNQGTTNLLSGFSSSGNITLFVNNSAAGPAPDVTVNIQTSVGFRGLVGTVAGPTSNAVVNLVGTGTELALGGLGTFAGTITGSGNVRIGSFSPQTFSGNNTYTGTTTVSFGGNLRIDGTTSGQGNYTVSSSTSFLGGSGTIGLGTNNTISVNGGRITAGASGATGTLHVRASGTGGVIIANQGAYRPEIGGSGASDLLAIAGGYIDLTSNSDALSLVSLSGAFDGSSYTIATFDQNLGNGIFDTVTGLPANYSIEYNPTSIVLAPVPEPGTIALGVEFCALLVGLTLRKRRS